MIIKITQLLNGFEDSSVPMEEADVVSAERIRELTMNKIHRQESRLRHAAGKRILSFALAAALLLALGAAAYAVHARAAVKIGTIPYEGEERIAPGFEAADSEPVYLGVWELSAVPDGFTLGKTMYRRDEARMEYRNENGDVIALGYEKAGKGSTRFFTRDILSQESVTINGNEGQLLVADNGWSHLYWTAAERGIGMILDVKGDYDLVALAESVRETDVQPPMDEQTRQALAQLGDWNPALPDGYAALVTVGYSGDYAYLNRTYANAAHYEIQLDYELAVSDLEGYVAYYRSGEAGYGVIAYTPVTINGCDGWLMEKEDGSPFRITWLDEGLGMVFQLSADGLDSDTLLRAAQGVSREN